MSVRIGTRGSKLALWQAELVKSRLGEQGISAELVLYKTTGDIQRDRPLYQIGEKGLFTKVLDDALLQGEIDLAVHSAKDVPTVMPEGLVLSAFLEREDPRDVLLAIRPEVDLDNLNGSFTLGTGSLRRQALTRHYAPNFEVKPIRGNVDTRVSKLESGEFDSIILAYAGVKRMGFTHLVRRKLNATTFTPAAGQGAIAIACADGSEWDAKIRELLDHRPTSLAVRAERAFLHKLEGGCHAPVFVLGTAIGEQLSLTGGVAEPDGSKVIRSDADGPASEPEALGISLAEIILSKGATKILNG